MSETNLKQNQAAAESAAAERDGAELGVAESAASQSAAVETSVAQKSGVSATMQKEAFQAAWPIVLGYIVLGIAFGATLAQAGYGPVWALAIGAVCALAMLFLLGPSAFLAPALSLTAVLLTVMDIRKGVRA